jgi:integrase/recombinase XerC
MSKAADLQQIINFPSTGAPGDLRSIGAEAVRRLLEDSRSENTRRAYETDLSHFFSSMGEGVTPAAVELLISQDAPALLVTLRAYVASLRKAQFAEATVQRRVSAIRALIRIARQLGAPTADPRLLVGAVKIVRNTDVEGPDLVDVARLLDAVNRDTLKGKRDYAILLLLATNGLRRGEIVSANVADFDRRKGRLAIAGKGQMGQKQRITLSDETADALRAYLVAREGPAPDAPLVVTCDRRSKGEEKRLTGRGLWDVVSHYAHEVLGVHLHPHQFRHTAITEAAVATGGNIPLVQEFSRHKDLATVMIYVGKARDGQGEITRILDGRLRDARRNKDAPLSSE